MKVKGIINEDFVNYKKICMTIEMPYCDFKCGKDLCQNSALAKAPIHDISIDKLLALYKNNFITEAICFQGMEPFDSADELFDFIKVLREIEAPMIWNYDTNNWDRYINEDNISDIVIYTGYTKEELKKKGYLTKLKNFGIINIENKKYGNIIIKFGRYIPGQQPHYDEVLGVNLASDNQYAERIE